MIEIFQYGQEYVIEEDILYFSVILMKGLVLQVVGLFDDSVEFEIVDRRVAELFQLEISIKEIISYSIDDAKKLQLHEKI